MFCRVSDDQEELHPEQHGVHIGQGDADIFYARKILGEEKIIGVSAHNADEALEAEKNGADYLGAGAVFATSTKSDVTSLALSELKNICRSVKIPVVAIGGITAENILKLEGSGAAGVAVVSAIFSQEDISSAARELKALAEKIIK